MHCAVRIVEVEDILCNHVNKRIQAWSGIESYLSLFRQLIISQNNQNGDKNSVGESSFANSGMFSYTFVCRSPKRYFQQVSIGIQFQTS